MVTIPEDETICKETELLLSLFSEKCLKGCDLHLFARRLQKSLDCFADQEIAKALYILHLVKITTPYDLARLLKVNHRNPVTNRLRKGINAGFVIAKSEYNADYEMIAAYWKASRQHTNNRPIFYFPTDALSDFVATFKEYLESLILESERLFLKKKGDRFIDHFERMKLTYKKRQETREIRAKESIGACANCTKDITIIDKKEKRCQVFEEKLYCKDCITQILHDGTASKILKKKAAKNRQ